MESNSHETKKKVVVTGGAGFIGTHLVRGLAAEGYDVHVVDNLSAGKKENVPPEATLHVLDIRNTAQLTEVCGGAAFICHLAALPQVQYSIEHPEETHDVNVNGTLSVLEAARAAGVRRVVFASSAAVYGDAEAPALDESMPVAPKSPYALHKYIGEEYGKLWHTLYGQEMVSLRFFNVYGPGARAEGAYALVTAIFLKRWLAGEPLMITGDGEQTRDFIHVRDIVRAIMIAATHPGVGAGEVCNIGSGVPTSINRIADLYGGEKEYGPARIEPKHSCAAVDRARKALDFSADIPLEEGIDELKRLGKGNR